MAGAVYWLGADGNVYLKSTLGVQKYTNPTNMSEVGFSGLANGIQGQDVQAQRIADPNAPVPTSTAPTGGGTTAAAPVFNQAGATNTQLAIDQIPGLLQGALANEATRYGNTEADLSSQETGQRETYGKSTTTNQQNFDETFMDSIRAGIHGLGGLMALLRGTGAAGGSVDDTVRDTVGGVTSQDIRTGADTQKENQTSLDTSLSTFLSDLKRKREMNRDTRVNNERAITRDSNTQLQDLYSKMAGFYGDAGRTAEYNDYMGRAGALTPSIAANSQSQLSNYDTTPVVVHAPNLTAFAEPTQPSVLAAPSNGQVGSGIFTMTDRRRKDPALAGA